jgi:hypothetical protein
MRRSEHEIAVPACARHESRPRRRESIALAVEQANSRRMDFSRKKRHFPVDNGIFS